MLNQPLIGKRVCILAKDGFELCEVFESRSALLSRGAEVHVVSLEPGTIISWDHEHWDIEIAVDKTLEQAQADDYDALILPGGHFNPGAMLHSQQAVNFVKGFFDPRHPKPVAAIRDGALMLIEAGVVKDRIISAYTRIKNQLQFSHARLVDQDVVIDKQLLTSRKSDTLDVINQRLIEEIQHRLN